MTQMPARVDTSAEPRYRRVLTGVALLASTGATLGLIDDTRLARGAAIAAAYLILALGEVVAPFVPTLLLWVLTPLALGHLDSTFQVPSVLGWSADPVLALFAGGLSLGLAAERHGIDVAIADWMVRVARGRRRALLGLVLLGTAFASMWMSNIAAAAMVLATVRPLLGSTSVDIGFRRAILLGVAVGANVGGMATPIGTGPNALAIAAAHPEERVTFLKWMGFAAPLVLGTLAAAFALLVWRYKVIGPFDAPAHPVRERQGRPDRLVLIFLLAVAAWLTEPIHHYPASLVALAVMLLLFATGLLRKADLGTLDWATLGLIAGGLSLGRLIEHTGISAEFASLEWGAMPRWAWLGGLVLASAMLSALMSNTASAALLIPLGTSIDPSPATAILIAVAASYGMPFIISTPPNAMAYGEGGLRTSDLAWIGLTLMLLGCALITLTGSPVLEAFGLTR